MASRTPLQINLDYPQGKYGTNLHTDGFPSPTEFEQTDLDRIRQITTQGASLLNNSQLVPIPQGRNTCYRDATLIGLLTLEPFLGYLDYYSNNPEASDGVEGDRNDTLDSLVQSLLQMADFLWDRNTTTKTKSSLLRKEVKNFWKTWQNLLGRRVGTDQEDVTTFLQALLQELDPTISGALAMTDLFNHIFQSQFVGRFAVDGGCHCNNKNRQQHRIDDNRFLLTTVVNTDRPTIESALAHSLYDDQGQTQTTCPTCGAEGNRHRYLKFRYLPELLFVQVDYVKQNDDDYPEPDFGSRCPLPEVINMDNLQDKIGEHLQQSPNTGTVLWAQQRSLKNIFDHDIDVTTDSTYRLKFVVDYHGGADDDSSYGHYRCHIRRSRGQWDEVDSMQGPESVKAGTLQQVESNKKFQPRLLAYQRQRQLPKALSSGDSSVTSKLSLGSAIKSSLGGSPKENLGKEKSTPSGTGAGANGPSGKPDYSTQTEQQLRQEVTHRGLALPPKRARDTLTQLLEQHDQNPANYGLYTVAGLTQKVADRGLQYAGKPRPLKKDLIAFLHAADAQSGGDGGLPASSSQLPPPPPPSSSSPPQQQQQQQQGPASGSLQAQLDALNKSMQDLRQGLSVLAANDLRQNADIQGLLQIVHSLAPAQQQQQHQQPQALADALAKIKDERARTEAYQHAYNDVYNRLSKNIALVVSVAVQEAAIGTQTAFAMHQQYLIHLPGHDGGSEHGMRTHHQFVAADGQGSEPRFDITINIDKYLTMQSTPMIYVISVPVPHHATANTLNVSTNMDLVAISPQQLIHELNQPLQQVPLMPQPPPVPATTSATATTGQKRTLDQAAGSDSPWATQEGTKRQR